jgi:hypothetical protein
MNFQMQVVQEIRIELQGQFLNLKVSPFTSHL